MCCPNEVCMSSRVRALRDAERSRVKRMPPHDPDVEFDAQMICDDCGTAFVEGRLHDVFPLIVLLGSLNPRAKSLSLVKA